MPCSISLAVINPLRRCSKTIEPRHSLRRLNLFEDILISCQVAGFKKKCKGTIFTWRGTRSLAFRIESILKHILIIIVVSHNVQMYKNVSG